MSGQTLSRCDDCMAQVDPQDWWNHHEWHQRNAEEIAKEIARATGCECACKDSMFDYDLDDLHSDITDLERRLDKLDGLAAIFTAYSERQLDPPDNARSQPQEKEK